MAFRPGPVFWVEARAGARRWRGYVVRAAFVAALGVMPVLGLWMSARLGAAGPAAVFMSTRPTVGVSIYAGNPANVSVEGGPMPDIFLSYRREDTQAIAGRIY